MDVLFHDDDVCMSRWHNVLVSDLHGTIRVRHLPIMERTYRDLNAQYPKGFLSLTIVSGIATTDRQLSREAAALMKRVGPGLRQVSVVLEVSGVFGAVVRTTLRGIAIIMNQPYAFRVHENLRVAVDELLPLIQEGTGQTVLRADFLAAIAEVRERYGKLKTPYPAPSSL